MIKHGYNTEAYQEHKAGGYGYKVVCSYDDNYNKPAKNYRGPDAVYDLIKNVLALLLVHKIMKNEFNKKMIISEKEEKDFKKSTSCHICGEKYKKVMFL